MTPYFVNLRDDIPSLFDFWCLDTTKPIPHICFEIISWQDSENKHCQDNPCGFVFVLTNRSCICLKKALFFWYLGKIIYVVWYPKSLQRLWMNDMLLTQNNYSTNTNPFKAFRYAWLYPWQFQTQFPELWFVKYFDGNVHWLCLYRWDSISYAYTIITQ